jgi:predicted tellurium resistance membrane protein TerC
MRRYPWVVLVAAGILGEVAGKMIVHDHFLVEYFGETLSLIEIPLRLALAGGIVLIGWIVVRRKGALSHPGSILGTLVGLGIAENSSRIFLTS